MTQRNWEQAQLGHVHPSALKDILRQAFEKLGLVLWQRNNEDMFGPEYQVRTRGEGSPHPRYYEDEGSFLPEPIQTLDVPGDE